MPKLPDNHEKNHHAKIIKQSCKNIQWTHICTDNILAWCIGSVGVYLWVSVYVRESNNIFRLMSTEFFSIFSAMGWLWLAGSLKLYVSFAQYSLFYRALLQKKPKILGSLLIVATPYRSPCALYVCVCVNERESNDTSSRVSTEFFWVSLLSLCGDNSRGEKRKNAVLTRLEVSYTHT